MADREDLVVPELGESITEAVIGRWLKDVGETVEADEPVVDLETDKVTVQLPAPMAGSLGERNYAEGDTVKVGDVVGWITSDGAAAAGKAEAERGENGRPAKAKAAADAKSKARAEKEPAEKEPAKKEPAKKEPAKKASSRPAPEPEPEPDLSDRRLTPAQRRAAREGAAVARPAAREAPSPKPAPKQPPAEAGDREEAVRMSPLRKRIAERLVQVQQETASLTTFNEVDMSAVMSLRARFKDDFEQAHGVKLGFMSFFVKACVAAARLYPGVNAEVRDETIVYKKHYDYGIAVSTERGLVVPVLRGVDALGFAQVEEGILALASKARAGKLTLDDLTGGTFSITNGGIYGSMLSTPILNYPQTGILGMHNIVKRPMVVGDSIEVRPMMYLALTYDHRVVDGREAVRFLVEVKERLEEPDRLMFEL